MSLAAPKAMAPAAARPTSTSPRMQRNCACEATGETCARCAGRKVRLQRKSEESTAIEQIPPVVQSVLSSHGHPLDDQTRAFMEPRFGYDFSRVRLHTDATAAASARAVNALAYTVGSHIAFAPGRFEPHAADGRRLLAHELTHVVQQSDRQGATSSVLSGGPQEQQAEAFATQIMEGGAVSAGAVTRSQVGLARAPAPPTTPDTPHRTPSDEELARELLRELIEARRNLPTPTRPPTAEELAQGTPPDRRFVLPGAESREARRTFAVAAVFDSDGNKLAQFSRFFKDGAHAEDQILAEVRAMISRGDKVAYTVMMVDQDPCPGGCVPLIKKFLKDPRTGALLTLTPGSTWLNDPSKRTTAKTGFKRAVANEANIGTIRLDPKDERPGEALIRSHPELSTPGSPKTPTQPPPAAPVAKPPGDPVKPATPATPTSTAPETPKVEVAPAAVAKVAQAPKAAPAPTAAGSSAPKTSDTAKPPGALTQAQPSTKPTPGSPPGPAQTKTPDIAGTPVQPQPSAQGGGSTAATKPAPATPASTAATVGPSGGTTPAAVAPAAVKQPAAPPTPKAQPPQPLQSPGGQRVYTGAPGPTSPVNIPGQQEHASGVAEKAGNAVVALNLTRAGLEDIHEKDERDKLEIWLVQNRPRIYQKLFESPGAAMVVQFHFVRKNGSLSFNGVTQTLRPDGRPPVASPVLEARAAPVAESVEGTGIRLFFPPVRKGPSATSTVQSQAEPPVPTKEPAIDSGERLIARVSSSVGHLDAYYTLKALIDARGPIASHQIRLGDKEVVATGLAVTQALGAYKVLVERELAGRLTNLQGQIAQADTHLQEALAWARLARANPLDWYRLRNRLALLDPKVLDLPRAHAAAAEGALRREDFRAAEDSLKAVWDLVHYAEAGIYQFRKGIDKIEEREL